MRRIEDIPKKNKGLIQHPYSIKARTLIYAHLLRFDFLTADLEKGSNENLHIQFEYLRLFQTNNM